jgi:hypothetical protein
VASVTATEIHTFPSDDENFRQAVARPWDTYSPGGTDALAALLLRSYPRVTVKVRESFAQLPNDGHAVWYVFRYGEAVPDDAEM